MLCRGRNQRVTVYTIQEAAGAVLLVMRPLLLGGHPATAVHHTCRLWGVDRSEGIYYNDISDLAYYGCATELGLVLTLASDHVSSPQLRAFEDLGLPRGI